MQVPEKLMELDLKASAAEIVDVGQLRLMAAIPTS